MVHSKLIYGFTLFSEFSACDIFYLLQLQVDSSNTFFPVMFHMTVPAVECNMLIFVS
jgi:hypothetical protein